ncbi:MAG: transcriptional repressor LexA [Spirochaetes bacterium]|nr:transcriptional repressor LexA [Spirochaetota bacterium]
MKGLTGRQEEVLKYIKRYITEHQFPPTIREIGENFGISVRGSYDHVKALEKKDYIKCQLNRSRAIELLPKANMEKGSLRKIPLLGNVAAGKPLFAEENFEGHVELPAAYLNNGKHFALNIKGDSMKDAGIMDGDVAVISHQNTADNGDIVVAMLDDAVVLKRFYMEKNRVKLKSENESYLPIYSQNVRILGRLTCIIRKYE